MKALVLMLTCTSIQTNATQSPLLRLPPEIRNIIWGFATGYQSIDTRYINHHVPMDRTNGTMGRSESTGTTRESNADTAHIPLRDATNKSPSAFHLPEVCRQIYAETATMSYALNTFLVDILQDTWVTSLLPAQREAIMQIEPDTGYSHLLIMDVFPDPPIWTRTFPSLRRLVISNASLDYLISRYTEGCWVRNRTMK